LPGGEVRLKFPIPIATG